ncbi:MAG: caspase family protein [Arenicella sp.]|nr:caspase family protein [Arenicella sp.]
MLKNYCKFCICLSLLFSIAGNATTESELRNSCLSKGPIYAVPACEQLIETTDASDKIHYHLATLYQKQNELEKARVTLERALAMFDAKGDSKTVAETARKKSNVEEEIWLQGNAREVDENAEHRVKCIKFSKILPQQALSSCDLYLASDPGDREVLQSRQIAETSLAKKAAAKNAPVITSVEQAPVVASRTPKMSAEKSDTAVKPELPQPLPANIRPSVVTQSATTAPTTTAIPEPEGQVSVDPKVIAEIKNELSSLYALLEKQKQQQAAAPQQSSYVERGKRYALVIGNAAYGPSIGKLKNPVNDAQDLGKKLGKLGFDVQLVTDGDLRSMEESVDKFAQKIREDDTALFYYAGHGVALGGENYLLPTGMGIKDSVDVKYKSLNLSFVLDKLDRGSSGVTMVVIDACRNNPFPIARGAASAGLVQSSGPAGTIIAYSTAPGDVALDGTGRNGLYTKHLLREIAKPNVKLEDVFKKVRVGVADDTQGAQVPWENSSLKGDFYFSYN